MAEVGAEVIAQSIIREAAINRRHANIQLVTELRNTLTEKGARSTLESGAGRKVNTGVADYVVNENIGIERDQDGKKQNLQPEEVARKNKIDTVRTLIDAYLQKGYDGLSDPQKKQARDDLKAIFNSYPAFQAVLRGMLAANEQAFLERHLRNPQLLTKLEQKYLEVFDVAKITPDSIIQINQEVSKLAAEVTTLNNNINNATNNLTNIKTDLQEFQVDVLDKTQTPPVQRRGIKYQEALTITHKIETVTGELAVIGQQLEEKKSLLEYCEMEKEVVMGRRQSPRAYVPRDIKDISNDINKIKGEITSLQINEINPRDTNLKIQQDRLKQYKAEEVRLKEKEKQTEEQKSNLIKEKDDKEIELYKKKQELSKLKSERRKSEDQFTQDVEAIYSSAADEYIKEQVDSATNEAKAIAEKQTQEAKDGRKKIILEGLSKKYFTGNKINAELIRVDYNTLLGTGPDTIIESLLSSGGYNGTQITEAKNDTAFMEEMRQKVGESVVKYFLLRGGFWTKGGSMRPDEILKIRESPWGQNLIENALKGRDDLRNEINKALGRDIITTGGKLQESIRSFNFETIFKILLFILGLGGAGLFGISKI